MNPHLHPPKINSVAMDQLPTPRTDAQGYRKTSWVKRSFARTLERELLATQARERVLRLALEQMEGPLFLGTDEDGDKVFALETLSVIRTALNHQ